MRKWNLYSVAAFLVLSKSICPAQANESIGLKAPSEVRVLDSANVNVLTHQPSFQVNDLTIGNGTSLLSHTLASYDSGYFWDFRDNFKIQMQNSVVNLPLPFDTGLQPVRYAFANVGHESQKFEYIYSDGSYKAWNRDGATFEPNPEGGFKYTTRDGVEYYTLLGGKPTIIYPNGFRVTMNYGNVKSVPHFNRTQGRLQSVTTNTGLQFKYDYASDSYPTYPKAVYPYSTYPNSFDAQKEFLFPTSITAVNNTYQYCSPTANNCSLNSYWPKVSYSWPAYKNLFAKRGLGSQGDFIITQPDGKKTVYTIKNMQVSVQKDSQGHLDYVARVTKVKDTTSSGSTTRFYEYENLKKCVYYDIYIDCSEKPRVVTKVKYGGAQWTYDINDYHDPKTEYVTAFSSAGDDPRGQINVVMRHGDVFPYIQSKTQPGLRVDYHQDRANRIKSVTEDGVKYNYEYDSRGNITSIERVDLENNSLTSTIERAGYDTNCDTLKTCNKPNWIRDARNKQTDYTYHNSSGYIKTITKPAQQNGVRPKVTYNYKQLYAKVKNSAGSLVNASSPVWMLTSEWTCLESTATATGCSDGDKIETTYSYDNNLWLKGTKIRDHKNNLNRLTCVTYDNVGNKLSETQPKGTNGSTCP